jgi:phenylacetate-CoA ligase
VITTLTKEAFPLIRYRTRDIARLTREPCACGRHTARMSRVTGRTDDMLIIRGVNVFPSQIEEALLRSRHHAALQDRGGRPGTLDEVNVQVEIRPELFSDRMDRMQTLRERISREIHTVAGIRAHVDLVEPRSIERFVGKANRVLDRRRLTE